MSEIVTVSERRAIIKVLEHWATNLELDGFPSTAARARTVVEDLVNSIPAGQ